MWILNVAFYIVTPMGPTKFLEFIIVQHIILGKKEYAFHCLISQLSHPYTYRAFYLSRIKSRRKRFSFMMTKVQIVTFCIWVWVDKTCQYLQRFILHKLLSSGEINRTRDWIIVVFDSSMLLTWASGYLILTLQYPLITLTFGQTNCD